MKSPEAWKVLPVAVVTKGQMTRLCGPSPLVLKKPVGTHYVRGLRADGFLRCSLSLVSYGRLSLGPA